MKLLKKPWFSAVLIFSFFPPVIIKVMPEYSQINQFYSLARVLAFIFILVLYIKRRKISTLMIVLVYFELLLVLITFYRQGNLTESLVNLGTILGFCFLLEIALDGIQKEFFGALYFVLSALIIINFVLYLKYPEGIYRDPYYWNTYNFLAIDNGLAKILVPAMTIGALYAYLKGRKSTMSVHFVNLCISLTMLLTWSATGVMGWFIVFFFQLFAYKRPLEKVFRFNYLLTLSAIVFFLIVVFRVQDVFSFLTEGLLGKSANFSGRTEIWSLAFDRFLQAPIFGYGMPNEPGLVYWQGIFVYAHNAVLEVLLQGGLVGLILYASLFLLAGRQLTRWKGHSLSYLFSASLFAFLIMMLMEPHTSTLLLYGLLTLSYHLPKLLVPNDGEGPL